MKITPKELRIGNIVLFEKDFEFITGIKYDKACCLKLDNYEAECIWRFYKYIKPVELNDFWLKYFSFNFDGNTYYNKNSFFIAVFTQTNEEVQFMYDGVVIKYVHQLQNMYFAIIGNELEKS